MESAKEKAIREAYGEHWQKVKDFVNGRGWCNYKALFGEMGNSTGSLVGVKTDVLNHFHPTYCYYNRPKSLRGFEDNNGWTRIESEADLPTEEMEYYWVKNTDGKIIQMLYQSSVKDMWLSRITHYQPIIKPKSPIY